MLLFLWKAITRTDQYVRRESVVALLGKTQRLHCLFYDRLLPEPIWKHNGTEISRNDMDFAFETSSKTLVFHVTTESAGKYECLFNQNKEYDRDFNVIVRAKPYWEIGPPMPIETDEEETVSFTCGAKGIPPPKIEFLKNGVLIPNNTEHVMIKGNKLTIRNVQKSTITGDHGDNAIYQCRAYNEHGLLWTNFHLRIFVQAPVPLSDSETLSVVRGQTAVLKCRFTGSPRPKITWKSPHLKGSESKQEVSAELPYESILELKNVQKRAAGDYVCTAKNRHGESSSRVTLVVRETTRLAPFSKVLEKVLVGKDLKLPCMAKHDPHLKVTYEWLINNQSLPDVYLKSGHFRIDDENTLHISNPTRNDAAQYECIAKTELDEAHKYITIDVTDVPQPLFQVFVNCTDIYALITFVHYEDITFGSPIKEVWVQYRISNEADGVAAWQTYPTPVLVTKDSKIINQTSMLKGELLFPLKPYGKYQFRAFGRNDIGDGKPVMAKGICMTASQRPDKNPDNVHVEALEPGRLLVTWRPMQREDWNGENFRYLVKHRELNNETWNETVVKNPYTDHVILEVPKKLNQLYEVQVEAVNDLGKPQVLPRTVVAHSGKGTSQYSPGQFKVKKIGSTSVTFSWDPALSNSIQDSLAGIKITFQPLNGKDSEDMNESSRARRRRKHNGKASRHKRVANYEEGDLPFAVIVAKDRTEYTIEGFHPRTWYKAQISVFSQQTNALVSKPIMFRTGEGGSS